MQAEIQTIQPLANNAFPVVTVMASLSGHQLPVGRLQVTQLTGGGALATLETFNHEWRVLSNAPAPGLKLLLGLDSSFAQAKGVYDQNRTMRDVLDQHISSILAHLNLSQRRPRINELLSQVTSVELSLSENSQNGTRIEDLVFAFIHNESVKKRFRSPDWEFEILPMGAASKITYPTKAPEASDFVLTAHACRLRPKDAISHGVLAFRVFDKDVAHQWEFHERWGHVSLSIFLDPQVSNTPSTSIIQAHLNTLFGCLNNLRSLYGEAAIPALQKVEDITFYITDGQNAIFACESLSKDSDLHKLFNSPDVECLVIDPDESDDLPFGASFVSTLETQSPVQPVDADDYPQKE